MYQPQPL